MATKRKTAASAPPAQAPAAETQAATPAQTQVAERPVAVKPAADTGAEPGADTGAEVILRTNFAAVEQDSIALLHAASLLIEADTPEKVNIALDHNLKLWIAIKAVLRNDDCPLDAAVKANLRNLTQYVINTTMEATEGTIEARRLVSLSRLNMNIAQGLLSGEQNRIIQTRAYEIWESEGRPQGREREHWLRAEAEFAGLLKE